MFLQRTQTVDFDPNNKEHRDAVRQFLKRKTWADSPIRFSHDAAYGSVASQVESKLLRWYVDQEEAKGEKKKSQLRTRVENAKVVDTTGTLPVHFLKRVG